MGYTQKWIFDSPIPPKCKMNTILKRKKIEEKLGLNKVTVDIIKDVKKLLEFCGIPYINSPKYIEAECVGALLANQTGGILITSDSDSIGLYGAPLVLKTKKNNIFIYDTKLILESMGIEFKDLQKISVHLGTDYAKKTKGVGPKSALQKYKSGKLKETNEQKQALEFVNIQVELPKFICPKLEKNKLRIWLKELNFNEKRVEKMLSYL